MSKSREITNNQKIAPETWYSLEDQDILDVAEEMEVKLSKAEICKVKELAPDYIDWFSAIENAVLFIKANKKKQ